MKAELQALFDAGYFTALNVRFARAVAAISNDEDPLVCLGAALASRASQHGHVCADLTALDDVIRSTAAEDGLEELSWAAVDDWVGRLRGSSLVGDGDSYTPLVLDRANRLYLARYYRYQARLASGLRARSVADGQSLDATVLTDGLDRLFDAQDKREVDWQRVAATVALDRDLCVISGGPGTGKTSTVVRILALLFEQAAVTQRAHPLRVSLVAPTGKAAARLSESIRRSKAGLNTDPAIVAQIPEAASTIHRALGTQHDRPTGFRHNAERPLAADVVIVDEASMVDLALMTKLVEAVPDTAKLILLGDENQLASVQVGAILGDICNTGQRQGYSAAAAERLSALSGEAIAAAPGDQAAPAARIQDCIAELKKSYRFDAGSGIGALARAIEQDAPSRALEVLADDAFPDVRLVPTSDDLSAAAETPILDGYRPYLEARTPAERLNAFDRFRILCAHHRGVSGVEGMNRLAQSVLQTQGLLDPDQQWYAGRPVLVRDNDYGLDLFNGDIGLIGPSEDDDGLRAYFSRADGAPRALAPTRLPRHDTVYAMTIHKSQGSEFEHVLIVLPKGASRILSRELLYTGVTRAKQTVTIIGDQDVIAGAIGRPIRRASGLRDALWCVDSVEQS